MKVREYKTETTLLIDKFELKSKTMNPIDLLVLCDAIDNRLVYEQFLDCRGLNDEDDIPEKVMKIIWPKF